MHQKVNGESQESKRKSFQQGNTDYIERKSFYGRRSIGNANGSQYIGNTQRKQQSRQAMRQINQIIKNIKEVTLKNKNIYSEIISKLPSFSHNLLHVGVPNFTIPQEETKITEQKLLRQLDKLYEENCVLQKQCNRLKFIEQNEEKVIQDKMETNLNHFQFLRNVWQKRSCATILKNSSECELSSEQMIEKINKNVALIRNNISLTLKQENTLQQTKQCDQNYIVQSKKYKSLLLRFETLQMQMQDQRAQNHRLRDKTIKNSQKQDAVQQQNNFDRYCQQLETKVKTLQSQLLKSQMQVLNYNEKIISLQNELKSYRKEDRYLRVIFQAVQTKEPILKNHKFKGQNKSNNLQKPIFEVKIFDRDFYSNIDNSSVIDLNTKPKSNIEIHKINCSVEQIIQVLKQKKQQITSINNGDQEVNLDISLTSIEQSQRDSINYRKSLTLVDMNKIIKADRKSMLDRSKKLSESISLNLSVKAPLRKQIDDKRDQQNFMPFQLEVQNNSINFEFPKQTLKIPEFKANEQNHSYLRTKFMRTGNRTRRDSLR